MEFNVSNIKFSFKLLQFSVSDYNVRIANHKTHGNFTIIRPVHDRIVVTLFSSGFVNVTGVKSLIDVKPSFKRVVKYLDWPINCAIRPTIDNISVAGHYSPIKSDSEFLC